jgi:hypothetical protein
MENQEEKATEVQQPTVIELIEKVKDTEEFRTLVKNNAKQYIGGELKTVYSTFDSVIKESLGKDKPDDIKSTEWIKQNLSKVTDLEKELETLKGKGDTNKEQEKLWNDKFNKLKSQLTAKEQEITNITQKGFKNNVSNQLDTYLVGKTFKPSYSEDDVNTLVEAKKAKIISNTRQLENGKVAVYNPSTESYYLDTLGEPLTPTQVAEKEFNTMFHVKSPGGDAPKNNTTTITEGDVITVDMSKIKSKQDFFNQFKKLVAPKGLASHEEKYLEIQRATMEHYKINALPLA